MKFLSFHENRRPAYFGTFSKKSGIISGRRPGAKDTGMFDYDFDSADEWEDEGEGESLSGSEGEAENDNDNGNGNGNEEGHEEEEEEGDKWVVPDGYLSADEGMDSDHERAPLSLFLPSDAAAPAPGTPTKKRINTDALADRDRVTKRDRADGASAIVVGIVWDLAQVKDASALNLLKPLIAQPLVDAPVDPYQAFATAPAEKDAEADGAACKHPLPGHVLAELVEFLHGASGGLSKLVEAFYATHPECSKRQYTFKMREIATKEKRPTGSFWMVKGDVLSHVVGVAPRLAEHIAAVDASLAATKTPTKITTPSKPALAKKPSATGQGSILSFLSPSSAPHGTPRTPSPSRHGASPLPFSSMSPAAKRKRDEDDDVIIVSASSIPISYRRRPREAEKATAEATTPNTSSSSTDTLSSAQSSSPSHSSSSLSSSSSSTSSSISSLTSSSSSSSLSSSSPPSIFHTPSTMDCTSPLSSKSIADMFRAGAHASPNSASGSTSPIRLPGVDTEAG